MMFKQHTRSDSPSNAVEEEKIKELFQVKTIEEVMEIIRRAD
jgi:hypothetical protein